MIIDSNLPLAQFKANLALALRTSELLQQGRLLWLEENERQTTDTIAEMHDEMSQIDDSADWQALASVPGHAAWAIQHRLFGRFQTMTQVAIANQTQFSAGLQQALAEWQQGSAKALSQAGNAMPVQTGLRNLLQTWGHLGDIAAEAATMISGKERPNG